MADQDARTVEYKPLIHRYSNYDLRNLSDVLLCIAANVEDSLYSAGASPSEYTRLDIYKLTVPLVMGKFGPDELSFFAHYKPVPSQAGASQSE